MLLNLLELGQLGKVRLGTITQVNLGTITQAAKVLFFHNILKLFDTHGNVASPTIRQFGASYFDWKGLLKSVPADVHRVAGGRYTGNWQDDDNASTPPLSLVALTPANISIVGDTITKIAGGANWNASAYSSNSFTGGAYVEVTIGIQAYHMLALNTDPLTDASYTSLDYAIYRELGILKVLELGSYIATLDAAQPGDTIAIEYIGTTVNYYYNDIIVYTTQVPAGLTLFLDTSFYDTGASLENVKFCAAKAIKGNPLHPSYSLFNEKLLRDVQRYATGQVIASGGSREDGGRWYTSALGGTTNGTTLLTDIGVTDWIDQGLYNPHYGHIIERAFTNPIVSPLQLPVTLVNSPTTVAHNSAIGLDGALTATTISFGNTTLWDTFRKYASLTIGAPYVISFYAKLGTATNLVVCINDTTNTNTMPVSTRRNLTTLSTTRFTRVTIPFIAPPSGQIHMHLGKETDEIGLPPQTLGTVIVTGFSIEPGTAASSFGVGTRYEERGMVKYPSSFFPQAEGTLFISLVAEHDLSQHGNTNDPITTLADNSTLLLQAWLTDLALKDTQTQATITQPSYLLGDTLQYCAQWETFPNRMRLGYRNASTGTPWVYSPWVVYSGAFTDTGFYQLFSSLGGSGLGFAVRNNLVLDKVVSNIEMDGFITL